MRETGNMRIRGPLEQRGSTTAKIQHRITNNSHQPDRSQFYTILPARIQLRYLGAPTEVIIPYFLV